MTRVINIVHDAHDVVHHDLRDEDENRHQLALREFVKAVDVVLSTWRDGDPDDLGPALDRLDAAAKAVQR